MIDDTFEPGPSAEEIAAQDRVELAKQPVFATETHQDAHVMRAERRTRVEQAFGTTERLYLEALEALADAVGVDAKYLAYSDFVRTTETDAAQKGRH